MPSAITMEQNGHSANGDGVVTKQPQNGQVNGGGVQMNLPIRSNNLPPEIIHISEGFIPLAKLISRLAQMTHNQLFETLERIANMPMPSPHALTNGNEASNGNLKAVDEYDQSNESVARKVQLNQTIQMLHGKWIKAAVITDWTKDSQEVSKLIDLRTHLMHQQGTYDSLLLNMMDVKRQLSFARVPSPDLKTALHVLATGDGSFMPDFNYIEPKPMTKEEIIKWIDDINTLLSIRLNVDDYDNIPVQFRDYTIRDGRVVFGVEGEFEVELTIGDEDFTKQFWFVDFRFKCQPAPKDISVRQRNIMEGIVNDALARENLTGCYNVLHEYSLTHKIASLRHQAIELGRTSWVGALSVESLDRAISLQYWPKRLGPNGAKHWIIVGVDSQIAPGWRNPKTTTKLIAQWFRDGRQVVKHNIPFDTSNLSCEKLVTKAISMHIEWILKMMMRSISRHHRYSSGAAALKVHIDSENPAKSFLKIQCSETEIVEIRIEPLTGEFKLSSHSKPSLHAENSFNSSSDPAHDAANLLGNMRCSFVFDECSRKSRGTGWICFKGLAKDEVKAHLQIRDPMFWHFRLQRKDMMPNWLLIMCIRPEGDEWYLCRVAPPTKTHATHRFVGQRPIKLDLAALNPDFSTKFWNKLSTFVHHKISDLTNLPIPITSSSGLANVFNASAMPNISIPLSRSTTADFLAPNGPEVSANVLSLHSVVPGASVPPEGIQEAKTGKTAEDDSKAIAPSSTTPWAHDAVSVVFNDVTTTDPFTGVKTPTWISSCIIRVLDKSKFTNMGPTMARDLHYNDRTGSFSIRIHRAVGTPLIPLLKPRLEAINRVVHFLDAMAQAGPSVQCESISLQRVSFIYTSSLFRFGVTPPRDLAGHLWRVIFDLSNPERVVPILDDHDPHQMVGVMLTRLANGPAGIYTLVRTLPRTLPLMEAISEVVATSPTRIGQGKGAVRALHLSAGASCLIYHLSSGFPIRLDIRARVRNGAMWWVLERVALDGKSLSVNPEVADEALLARLRVLFERGDEAGRWTAMGSGLTTKGVQYIREMVLAADAVVWGP